MAILWSGSLAPWIDKTGAPYSGAKAYFFDAGTTAPLTTYSEASLSITNDHPVVADAAGFFPPVFLPDETVYRLRITTSAEVTVRDIDNISAPTTTVPEPPTSNTETQYLYQTGDIKMAWRSSAPTGYVRLNGRTIGGASSAATERANADCEALFKFLWNNDSNLVVSGGRGSTADGDWAASKTIALPDFRGRAPVAPDSFGSTAAGRITDDMLGVDSDLLGSAGGEGVHTLTEAELPEHGHAAGTLVAASAGSHRHALKDTALVTGGEFSTARYTQSSGNSLYTEYAGDHEHTITGSTADAGSGDAHNNIQPSIIVPFFIKL